MIIFFFRNTIIDLKSCTSCLHFTPASIYLSLSEGEKPSASSRLRQCQRLVGGGKEKKKKHEDAIFFLNHTHLHITISIHKKKKKRRLKKKKKASHARPKNIHTIGWLSVVNPYACFCFFVFRARRAHFKSDFSVLF